MSNPDQSSSSNGADAPYVQLFQKAHQKIVLLERLHEQMAQLKARREELQEELRELQAQINDEFDTRLDPPVAGIADLSSGLPQRQIAVTIGEAAKRNGGSGRFAATTIDAVVEPR